MSSKVKQYEIMQWLVFSGIELFPWVVLMSRKEKSLSHVAMVAKFLDDIKPKTSLKSELALFQRHRSYPISLFNFVTLHFSSISLRCQCLISDDEKLMLFYSRRFIRYQNSRNIWINFGLFACPDISNPEFKVNTSKSNECSGIKWCV